MADAGKERTRPNFPRARQPRRASPCSQGLRKRILPRITARKLAPAASLLQQALKMYAAILERITNRGFLLAETEAEISSARSLSDYNATFQKLTTESTSRPFPFMLESVQRLGSPGRRKKRTFRKIPTLQIGR